MRDVLKGLLPRTWSSSAEERVHMDLPDAGSRLATALCQFGLREMRPEQELVLLCVGTDRSIGDALGPITGSLVAENGAGGYHVLGTLENPVHASNLSETLDLVNRQFARPFVVAVDACLGRSESIGILTVGRGSLKPGAGVNKSLPPVGQIYVTGVVNVGGFMEYFVLQNTRLSLVMRMARVVAAGICQGLDALLQARREAASADEG